MFCNKCGVAMADDDPYCGHCGNPNIKINNRKAVNTNESSVENMYTTGKNYANANPIVREQQAHLKQDETVDSNTTNQEPDEEKNVFMSNRVGPVVTNPELLGVSSPLTSDMIKLAKADKGTTAKKVLLSVLISFLMLIFSFYAISVASIREYLDSDEPEILVEDIDVSDFVDTDGKLYDRVYHRTDIDDFAVELVEDYTEYMLGGEEPVGITPETISDLLLDNRKRIEKILSVEFLDSAELAIEEYIEDHGAELFGILYEGEKDSDSWKKLEIIRALISVVAVAIVLILLFGVFVWLIILRKRISSVCLYTGIPVLIASIPMVAAGMFSGTISENVAYSIGFTEAEQIINQIVSGVSDCTFHYGIIVMIVSLVLMVTGIWVSNKKKKYNRGIHNVL